MTFNPPAQPIPYGNPMAAVGIGIDTQMGMQPQAVPLEIDWSIYCPNGGPASVLFDLSSGVPAPRVDEIRAIRINNQNSPVTVYVLFETTGQIVVCPPGVVMEPVLSAKANYRFIVFTDGLINGNMPITYIDILNTNRAGYFVPDVISRPTLAFASSGRYNTAGQPRTFNYSLQGKGNSADRLGIFQLELNTDLNPATVIRLGSNIGPALPLIYSALTPTYGRALYCYSFDATDGSGIWTPNDGAVGNYSIYLMTGLRSQAPVNVEIVSATGTTQIANVLSPFLPEGGIALAHGQWSGGANANATGFELDYADNASSTFGWGGHYEATSAGSQLMVFSPVPAGGSLYPAAVSIWR